MVNVTWIWWNQTKTVTTNQLQTVTTHTHTHTHPHPHSHPHSHPFNDPLSGTTRLSRGTRKVKPIWILLEQETASGSGISWAIFKSASRSRQITTPVPHHSVFYRPDALPAAQPTVSKHWRHRRLFFLIFCYFLFNSSGRLGVSFFTEKPFSFVHCCRPFSSHVWLGSTFRWNISTSFVSVIF